MSNIDNNYNAKRRKIRKLTFYKSVGPAWYKKTKNWSVKLKFKEAFFGNGLEKPYDCAHLIKIHFLICDH